MSLRLLQLVPDLATVDALAEPWQKLYAHSTTVATLVLFSHVAGLVAAAALIFSTETSVLRLDPADDAARGRYHRIGSTARGPLGIALGIAMLSGVMLFLADLEAFAISPVFWTKIALVALLLANVLVASRLDARLHREGATSARQYDRLWRRRRASAWTTAVLWLALLLCGSALALH